VAWAEDSFLGVPFGARGQALGGAYSAVANNGEAVLWNPAGLAQVDRLTLSGSQNHLSFTDNIYAMTLSVPFGRWGTAAVSAQQLTVENVGKTRPVLDSSGNPVLDPATNTPLVEIAGFGQEIDASFIGGYGVALVDWLMMGGSAKVLVGNSVGVIGDGLGVDAGLLLKPYAGWRVGIVTEDIGRTTVRWRDGTRTRLEPSGNIGAAWEPGKACLFSAQIGSPLGKADIGVSMGAEWRMADFLMFRAGMQDWRMTGGVGFGMPLPGGARASADYAFVTGSQFEDRNRLTLAVQF